MKKEYDKQLKEIEDKEPKMEDDKYNNLGRFDALKKWDDDFSEWKKEKHRIKVQYNKALEDRKKLPFNTFLLLTFRQADALHGFGLGLGRLKTEL